MQDLKYVVIMGWLSIVTGVPCGASGQQHHLWPAGLAPGITWEQASRLIPGLEPSISQQAVVQFPYHGFECTQNLYFIGQNLKFATLCCGVVPGQASTFDSLLIVLTLLEGDLQPWLGAAHAERVLPYPNDLDHVVFTPAVYERRTWRRRGQFAVVAELLRPPEAPQTLALRVQAR